ncbi:MAG: hypothetical protein AAFX87_26930 [Bacteroidota bacterium]
MKTTLLTLTFAFIAQIGLAQEDNRISTIDFVQILDGNSEEAIFYYENNWLKLRKEAVKKGYIGDYQLLKVESTDDAPFHLMLVTTYANKAQFDQREPHFQELIQAKGELKLLNGKKPGDFRKVIFAKTGSAPN